MKTNNDLKQDRTTHMGRLLLELSKDFVASSNEKMREKGYAFVRTPHIRVLSQIATEGTELSEIIKRVGLSKQAVNKIIRQLEEHEIVSTRVSELDSRARVVHFTAKGKKFLQAGLAVIEDLEKEYLAVLGKNDFAHLKQSLAKIGEARKVMSRTYQNEDDSI